MINRILTERRWFIMATHSPPDFAPGQIQILEGVKFRYILRDFPEFTPHGLLVVLGHFAQQIGLVRAFAEQVHIDMQTREHSPQGKLLTAFLSLVAGLASGRAIKEVLGGDTVVAQAWGLPRFADQSLVSDVLHALQPPPLEQLEGLYQTLWDRHSRALQQPLDVPLVVDLDQVGLSVSPEAETIEGVRPGYFVEGPGHQGLQFAAAFVGAPWPEALGGCLQPGNAHLLWSAGPLLDLLERRLGAPPRRPVLLTKLRALWEQQARQAEGKQLVLLQKAAQKRRDHDRQAEQGRHREADRQALQRRAQRFPQRAERYRARPTELRRQSWHGQECARRSQEAADRSTARADKAHQTATDIRQQLAALGRHLAQDPRPHPPRALILRADAAVGTLSQVALWIALGYGVVVKAYASTLAAALVRQWGDPLHWERAHEHLRVAEVPAPSWPECPVPVRAVVLEYTHESGAQTYSALLSNLPAEVYPPLELVHFYPQRPPIEAFNKVLLRVLHFEHLRTRCLGPHQAMAQLGLWAYTFLQWARDTFFTGTSLEGCGLADLVEYGLTVIAPVSWEGSTCTTALARQSAYSRAIVQPRVAPGGQLRLPLEGLDVGGSETP
jgi:hypothetical protein